MGAFSVSYIHAHKHIHTHTHRYTRPPRAHVVINCTHIRARILKCVFASPMIFYMVPMNRMPLKTHFIVFIINYHTH